MTTPMPSRLDSSDRRLAVRSEVAIAARPIAPLWPAKTVIAVNPLLGLLEQSFTDAARQARSELGADAFREIGSFRDDFASGRISPHHLRESLITTVEGSSDLRPIATPNGEIDAVELLMADLIAGPDPAGGAVLESLAARCDRLLGSDIAGKVDRIICRWLAAYTDRREAAIGLPVKRDGFHAAARLLTRHDREISDLLGLDGVAASALFANSPEESIDRTLADLGIGEARRVEEIRAQLLRVRGWSGWIKWRNEWAPPECDEAPIDLVELAAVRLVVEGAAAASSIGAATANPVTALAGSSASEKIGPEDPEQRLALALGHLDVDASSLSAVARAHSLATLSRIGDTDRLAIWLGAQEAGLRDGLLTALDGNRTLPRATRPSAQVVFCIDVRSEGMRRHLEAVGDSATLGFAGFFAVAVNFKRLGAASGTPLCPVLLSPTADIEEIPLSEAAAERLLERQALRNAFSQAFKSAKSGMASPFALAEAGGLAAGWVAAARTFSLRLARLLNRNCKAHQELDTRLAVTAGSEVAGGFSDAEQVRFAHAALTMMGLTEGFSRLVVFCSHGSDTVNNPYASALDCGACGGNAGAPNARIAAAILNRPELRRKLAEAGIEIPADTVFAAANHDTASDTVTILDRDSIPQSHATDLKRLESDLAAAGRRLAAERETALPGSGLRSSDSRVPSRGSDWAQVRPEWGLANNAAFIVGDRSITEGIDLGCRSFLHSYRADADPDGSALETILTAPLVVAHWINSQYYFSTVDPDVFGAGDKTLHNVTGNGAILAGGGGDLKVGLPWQSVGVGEDAFHEPLRLLAVVEAPLDRIERIIADNPILQHMIGGGWVSLAARSDDQSRWHIRSRGGTWCSWVPAAADPRSRALEEALQ